MKRLLFNSIVLSTIFVFVGSCGGGGSAAKEIENDATADNPKPDNKNPKGTPTFQDTFWDFKRVEEGEEVKHSFVFRNTGKGDLIIRNAQASCGCTSPNWSREAIPPGKTGFVDAKFNSSDRGSIEGMPNEKNITVTFDNSTQEQVTLKFKATVYSSKDKKPEAEHKNH